MNRAAELADAIVASYGRARRDLPWRRTGDPYAIWVSEIMLQQTRVHTVIPFWERWMTRFPDVRALATASLDDVLAAWSGLGYYSRARNLWHGAKQVVATSDGRLPARASELTSIPGIGRYTAGAIASIAYGERAPLVDGNVARVLARVFAIDADIKSSAGQREVWTRAGEVMDALPATRAPGDLNQGLMELGATTCAPVSPRCLVCPISTWCATRGDSLPNAKPRRRADELPILERAALWLEDGGELVLARRIPGGLFGGLWELPQGETREAVARALGVADVDPVAVAHHQQTLAHRRLRIAVFRAALPARLVTAKDSGYDAIARVPLARVKQRGVAASTVAILTQHEDQPWSSIPRRSTSSRKATTRSSKASRSSASRPRTKTSKTPASARRKRFTSSSTTRSK